MNKLEEKVLDTIKKYNLIEEGDKLVVAVSGGPDSICLLDILNEIIKKEINEIKYSEIKKNLMDLLKKVTD